MKPPTEFLKWGIFVGFHVATVVLVVLAGLPTLEAGLLCAGLYFGRMFFITGAYHRYFSHRTYKTSRPFQFLLALGGLTSLQKGAVWWAAKHRHHHRYSDLPEDVHSPIQRGLWWAHVGWVVSSEHNATDLAQVKDLARFPELMALESHKAMIGVFAAICLAVQLTMGFNALAWGCFVSTVLLWHGTFTINSLSHVWGARRYATTDTSRNNLWLALITMGEGWHNNHHFYMASAAQGFRWWQIDVTYYILWTLERVGLIWDMKRVPADVVAGRLGGRDWLIQSDAPQPEPINDLEPVAGSPA
jgi:stearoyl-CoA desaturase (Delta-9 desaturase)